ncbi:hypothetical protein CYMTET_54372 [Cymbomonas tetramitiformis]|uniref:CBS domain-containing protein n=1 Tax=Cymbomonas tetramitiformis TaxID=36881 RepID=A0AAE0BFB9_9CHLO|nr:hypothetical protein CYMTET_54372 [Cymbomonas tetramitiformis]
MARVNFGTTPEELQLLKAQLQCASSGQTATKWVSMSCSEKDTLRKVISKLAKTGFHRVFIVDTNYHPIGVIAVSDVCKLFQRYLPK